MGYEVIKNESRIVSVDFNPRTMMVYWVDEQENAIKRSFIPRSAEQPESMIGYAQEVKSIASYNGAVLSNSNREVRPTSVATDWVTGNLYWTEVSRSPGHTKLSGAVVVSKADGRYAKSLIASGVEEPLSVVVDPQHGLMFWSDGGSVPKIERAWMDGSKRRTIVVAGLGRPECLAMDYNMDHTLYWVDSKLNVIESADSNGERRHQILRGDSTSGIGDSMLRRPVSIDVFESNMFWVNRDTGAVVQQDKFGRGVPVSVAKNLNNPRSVKVLHSLRYNMSLVNPCTHDHSNPCSHLCLVIPFNQSRCACPDGQRFLNADQTNCDGGEELFAWLKSIISWLASIGSCQLALCTRS